jgi:hypothetical protein
MDENQMNQMHMDPYMHNIFWHEDQICITFQLSPNIPTIPSVSTGRDIAREAAAAGDGMPNNEEPPTLIAPTFNKDAAITAMNLDRLDEFLRGKYKLSSFRTIDTLRTEGSTPSDTRNDLNSGVGKYLFTTKDEQGRFVPTVISFFNFTQEGQEPSTVAHSFAELAPMFGMTPQHAELSSLSGSRAVTNGADDKRSTNNNHGHRQDPANSPVVKLVTLINDNPDDLRQKGIPIVAASPIWLAGGTNNGSQPYGPKPVGCPLTPPIPVAIDTACSSSPGLYPITLPELPPILRPMSGDGVTVFVLDTLPKPEEINRAVEAAEKNNVLLLDVANNVKLRHNRLPDSLDVPSNVQPATGKDVEGRLVGFRMPDHGLFVAGIVRDIAPNAHVECIRVLNDYCVGDLPTLTKALEGIHNRMLQVNPDAPKPDGSYEQGDLFQKPVVVNMSLVIPPDEEVTSNGFKSSDLDNLRKALLNSIQSLVYLGVVFVASAGNEGDLRYPPANPDGTRPNALYPAAFAYHGLKPPQMMVPVGAVDKHGNAASYSCYPGYLGISTYGGEVPIAARRKLNGCFTGAENVDAPIGIYTSLSYPALSIDDCEPTYPVPNGNAWAYWVGTSFATPIIAALVARILEYILRNSLPGTVPAPNTHVWYGITSYAPMRRVTWDRIGAAKETQIGPMIWAVQCASTDWEGEDEEEEEERSRRRRNRARRGRNY